jgi:hypothetical protein
MQEQLQDIANSLDNIDNNTQPQTGHSGETISETLYSIWNELRKIAVTLEQMANNK